MIRPNLYINSSTLNDDGDIIDNWMQADLDENVKISIKDTVKDAKDVGKVFTAYTNQFKLPASPTNNRIFKRWGNFNVLNGYDSRRKHSALIKLNGIDYKKGYIKLNSVNLEKNMPVSYNVQFYGELSSLKDILGEHKLGSLVSLGKYSFPYNYANMQTGLSTSFDVAKLPPSTGETGVTLVPNAGNGMFKVPLISHTRGFMYADSDGGFRELAPLTGLPAVTSPDRLTYTDLKPAIKLSAIFDAIEEDYPQIVFNKEWLFGAEDPSTLDELYVWLHNKKGYITYSNSSQEGGEDGNVWTRLIKDFGAGVEEGEMVLKTISAPDFRPFTDLASEFKSYRGKFTVRNITGSGFLKASVTVVNSNGTRVTELVEWDEETAEVNVYFDINSVMGTQWLEVKVLASGAIEGFAPALELRQFIAQNPVPTFNFFDASSDEAEYEDTLIYSEIVPHLLLPQVKILSFLSDLMKTYNLIAVEEVDVNDNYKINIMSVDHWLETGRTFEATQYVDIDRTSIERIAPYSSVEYLYDKPKTFLAINQGKITGDEFGGVRFDVGNFTQGVETSNNLLFDGGKYDVKPKFEKMMYERLNNTDGTLTDLQWGWFVNDNKKSLPEPVDGKLPLILYCNKKTISDGRTITWGDDVVTSEYFAPSNVSYFEDYTTHFNTEFDEWTRELNDNSIFAKFHNKYISSIYSNYARRYIVETYLPPLIFQNLKLNDIIVINRNDFYIEGMDIDITTAKTKLKLLRLTDIQAQWGNRGRWQDDGLCLIWNEAAGLWEETEELWDCNAQGYDVSLVAYYRGEQNFDDSSGNNHQGTGWIFDEGGGGEEDRSPTFGSGVDGDAICFAANEEHFWMANSEDFTFSANGADVPYSISAWKQLTLTPADGNSSYFASRTDTNEEWEIKHTANGFEQIELHDSTTGGTLIAQFDYQSNGYVLGQWYHIVWTYDGSATAAGIKLYIDNVEETLTYIEDASYVTMRHHPQRTTIGVKNDHITRNEYVGCMDEIMFFKGLKLNSEQIDDLYQMNAPTFAIDDNTVIVAQQRTGVSISERAGRLELTPKI